MRKNIFKSSAVLVLTGAFVLGAAITVFADTVNCTVKYKYYDQIDMSFEEIGSKTESVNATPLVGQTEVYGDFVDIPNIVTDGMGHRYRLLPQQDNISFQSEALGNGGRFTYLPQAQNSQFEPKFNIPLPSAYQFVAEYERLMNYRIKYVDENGNELIPNQMGEGANNEWVQLLYPSFTASLYDAGVRYKVKQDQGLGATTTFNYISETDIKVCLNDDVYEVECEKVQAATPSNSGGSGGGSGSGSSSSRTFNNSGQTVKQGWVFENNEWYYFSGTTRSSLKKGWHLDTDNNEWYYLEAKTGRMMKGWHLDPQDNFWYYLDLNSGKMKKGWENVNEKWYYFNPYTPKWTWELHNDGEWYYKKLEDSRPLGSMYFNEKTPDGYFVNGNGEYVK